MNKDCHKRFISFLSQSIKKIELSHNVYTKLFSDNSSACQIFVNVNYHRVDQLHNIN